jgi:plastocyanin
MLVNVPCLSHAATVQVEIQSNASDARTNRNSNSSHEIVVWLSARPGSVDPQLVAPVPGRFRIEQKDKTFHPHLLVVPLGSLVEFPNRDPFFHNVFSQFNGKRFDLGLYEAGTSRAVRFDHEGASYIFCNIHSQMAAVIIAVGTRFYTVLKAGGKAELKDVPPGDYVLHVWREGVEHSQLARLSQQIHLTGANIEASPIQMPPANPPAPHKNKFGEEYPPEDSSPYPQ